MRKKIPQRLAHQYKRELEELKRTARADRSTWGGVDLVSFPCNSETVAKLDTAQQLGHPLACRYRDGTLHVFGIR